MEAPKRPWWRRKRVPVVFAALVLAAYPVSLGPVHYFAARGWLSRPVSQVLGAFHEPLTGWCYNMERVYGTPTHSVLLAYVVWWREFAGER